MPTNAPYDTRVVNPGERPVTTDFNLAQSAVRGTIQQLAGQLFNPEMTSDIATTITGFISDGFRVDSVSGMQVTMRRGVGYQSATQSTFSNLGGVTGINDATHAHLLPLVANVARTLSVPPAPTAADKCRVDVIAVKPLASLTEETTTSVFNATTQVFSPQPNFKTASFDPADDVYYMPAGGAALATGSVVYIPGLESAYTNADSFLTASGHIIPTGYTPIAQINVGPQVTEITDNDIVDRRRLLFANQERQLSVRFRGGRQSTAHADTIVDDGVATRLIGRLWRYPTILIRSTTETRYRIVFPVGDGAYDATAISNTAFSVSTPQNIDTGSYPISWTLGPLASVANVFVTRLDSALRAAVTDPNSGKAVLRPISAAIGQLVVVVDIDVALPWEDYTVPPGSSPLRLATNGLEYGVYVADSGSPATTVTMIGINTLINLSY